MAGLLQIGLIWVAYAAAVGLALVVAAITTFTWQAPRERSAAVTTVAMVTITALLATVFLLPVDIALVSATTSTALGAKKAWATPARVAGVLRTLRVAYYTLYGVDALLCLAVVPFTYFWYEEYDELDDELDDGDGDDGADSLDAGVGRGENHGRTSGARRRLWRALRYTAIFLAMVAVVLLVGFFAPTPGGRPDPGQGGGGGGGGDKHRDLDYFRRLLSENGGEKVLTFALGLLTTLGALLYVPYTGAGLALLPISLIKSAPAISAPQLSETTASALAQNRERQRQLELRNGGGGGGGRRGDGGLAALSAKDRRELEALRREERTLVRRERLAAEARGAGRGWVFRCWSRVQAVLRPLKLVGGVLLLGVALLVAVSMLISGIDKAANSVCKQRCGYILAHVNVFQPINWLFVQTARAFPVDYVLMALLVLFFFSSAVSGLAAIGIRFLWVPIFVLRRGRTAPQGILAATVLLALMMLAIHYAVAMLVAPQYASYGTQTFCMNPPAVPGAQPDCRDHPQWIKPCSEAYEERAARDVCTPTVLSTLLNRVTLHWPVLGAVDFWAQFAFLGVFFVVFATALFRTPKLDLAELDAEAEADEEEGLLASTGRRFGATWQDVTGRTRGRNAYGSRS